MAGSREIRRKIKATKATKQITRAMELVSAAKMKRAVNHALGMRSYASTALLILTHLADKTHADAHPLLAVREVTRVLVVVSSSDRGLCGSFNALLFKKVLEYERELKREMGDVVVEYIAVGKRAQDFLSRSGRTIIAACSGMTNRPSLESALPVAKIILDAYLEKRYDRVALLYQHFLSALVQKPTVFQLLPFSREILSIMGGELGLFKHFKFGHEKEATEYLFEPSADIILEQLLPQLTRMQVYQSILETAASEHSARMVAMRSATDNATEMIGDLTLHLNQVRQAGITREIAEISAGKIALGL
jgi:F-type H+-transporting ATPase subunit gamma